MTAILALHGFTGTPGSWDFLGPARSLPRVSPALVGHAGSDAGSDVTSFDAEIERLGALIPEPSAHVVGYSLGARLALGLALRYPERVVRLTLLSCHPGLPTPAERAARRASDAAWCELLITRGVPAFAEAWQAQPLWTSQARLPDSVRRRRQSERLTHSARGLAHSLRATGLGEMPSYGRRLAELRMPVTLLAGALDNKFSELARQMSAQLPNALLEIVADAGHDLLLERPALVTEVIRRGTPT